jgi:hypothetical protein
VDAKRQKLLNSRPKGAKRSAQELNSLIRQKQEAMERSSLTIKEEKDVLKEIKRMRDEQKKYDDWENELAFRAEDVIHITSLPEDEADDGFFVGSVWGSGEGAPVGLVPSNYVKMLDPTLWPTNQSDWLASDEAQQYYAKEPQLMVALFDYDPKANSANDDNDDELQFFKGQYILVYGDVLEDGYYYGELMTEKTKGMVPSNFVEAATEADLDAEAALVAHPVGTELVALYDYDSNVPEWDEEDLTFIVGQKMTVIEEMDESGYYICELDGKTGSVPGNMVDAADADESG